jgi:hypothetical protein
MGLDNYASRTPELGLDEDDEAAFREANVHLCECDGDSSFRGKLYVSLVLEVTGVALVSEWIPPEVVRRMAEVLAACDADAAVVDEQHATAGDVTELARFFGLCADRGLGLIGSW